MDKLSVYSHYHSRLILIANSMLSEPIIEFSNGLIRRKFAVLVSVSILPDDAVDKPESQFHKINSFVGFLGVEKEADHGIKVRVVSAEIEDPILSAERFMDKFETIAGGNEIAECVTDYVDNLNAQFCRDRLVLVDIGHFASAALLAL